MYRFSHGLFRWRRWVWRLINRYSYWKGMFHSGASLFCCHYSPCVHRIFFVRIFDHITPNLIEINPLVLLSLPSLKIKHGKSHISRRSSCRIWAGRYSYGCCEKHQSWTCEECFGRQGQRRSMGCYAPASNNLWLGIVDLEWWRRKIYPMAFECPFDGRGYSALLSRR